MEGKKIGSFYGDACESGVVGGFVGFYFVVHGFESGFAIGVVVRHVEHLVEE